MISLDTVLHGLVAVFPHALILEAGRYFVTAGLVSLVTWIFWRSWFRPRKLQSRFATANDYRREVLASVRTVLIFAVTGFGMYLAARAGCLTVYKDFSVQGPAYFAATLALMIVAHDAYFYWTHRAMHHPRLFRTFHWTHHKSRTPTPWTAYAFDAPEAIVMVAFVPLWAAIVPMHDTALYIFMTWQIARNVIGHAGVEFSPVSGRPSRLWGWLNTTTHHYLHHQSGRTNYGLYFSWWDRWMDTENPEYQTRVADVAERSRAARKPIASAPTTAMIALLALAAVVALPHDAGAQTRSDIEGRWYTKDDGSIVAFAPCGGAPATLCGRIVWLRPPNDDAGRARRDGNNPHRALKGRPLVGVEIVRGLRPTGPGAWGGGQLYNPDDGRTYTGSIRLENGALRLRGCAFVVFCQTQTWRRAVDRS